MREIGGLHDTNGANFQADLLFSWIAYRTKCGGGGGGGGGVLRTLALNCKYHVKKEFKSMLHY